MTGIQCNKLAFHFIACRRRGLRAGASVRLDELARSHVDIPRLLTPKAS